MALIIVHGFHDFFGLADLNPEIAKDNDLLIRNLTFALTQITTLGIAGVDVIVEFPQAKQDMFGAAGFRKYVVVDDIFPLHGDPQKFAATAANIAAKMIRVMAKNGYRTDIACKVIVPSPNDGLACSPNLLEAPKSTKPAR